MSILCKLSVILISFILFESPLILSNPTPLSPTQQAICDTLGKPLLYVPWREDYISTMHEKPNKPTGCPYCLIIEGNDDDNFVLARFKYNFIMINLYPYSRGHLMIVPYLHVKTLAELPIETQNELMMLITACTAILPEAVGADGFNIGINIGKASAASLPDHIHAQVLPRFDIEPIGYLQLVCETPRVIHWNLKKLYTELKPYFQQLLKATECNEIH